MNEGTRGTRAAWHVALSGVVGGSCMLDTRLMSAVCKTSNGQTALLTSFNSLVSHGVAAFFSGFA